MPDHGPVLVIDCSLPPGHPKAARYRRLTRAERAQRDRDRAEAAGDRRAQAFVQLRMARDDLLRLTDHLRGEPRWERWRTRLRDLPGLTLDPEKPRWPKPPTALSCLYPYRSLWPRLDWSTSTKGTP